MIAMYRMYDGNGERVYGVGGMKNCDYVICNTSTDANDFVIESDNNGLITEGFTSEPGVFHWDGDNDKWTLVGTVQAFNRMCLNAPEEPNTDDKKPYLFMTDGDVDGKLMLTDAEYSTLVRFSNWWSNEHRLIPFSNIKEMGY